MLFLGYKIYLIWSQKSTYYTIYFIFLNYLHICTIAINNYKSNHYKCADSMQMKTDYEIVLSGLCILINKISKTIKTFFVLEHCISKISHSQLAGFSIRIPAVSLQDTIVITIEWPQETEPPKKDTVLATASWRCLDGYLKLDSDWGCYRDKQV